MLCHNTSLDIKDTNKQNVLEHSDRFPSALILIFPGDYEMKCGMSKLTRKPENDYKVRRCAVVRALNWR
jgi:hypothetical protein